MGFVTPNSRVGRSLTKITKEFDKYKILKEIQDWNKQVEQKKRDKESHKHSQQFIDTVKEMKKEL